MSYIGIEFGNLKSCAVYKRGNQLYAVDFGNGDRLFSACSKSSNTQWKYGEQCLQDVFSPNFSVFTHALQIYPLEYNENNIQMITNDIPVLLTNCDRRIAYVTDLNEQGYFTPDHIISTLVKQIYNSYCVNTNGWTQELEITLVLPDAYVIHFRPFVTTLLEIFGECGFRRVSCVEESRAVIRTLSQNNVVHPNVHYLIVCCGEIYNDYRITNLVNTTMNYPTPSESGRTLEYAIARYVMTAKLPEDEMNFFNGLPEAKKSAFQKACVFSVRISLLNYLHHRGAFVVYLRLQNPFQIVVEEEKMNQMCFEYARRLANHAYTKVQAKLPTSYKIVLSGDFGELNEVKIAFGEVFKVDVKRISVMPYSTFAEGALLECEDAHELRPNFVPAYTVCFIPA